MFRQIGPIELFFVLFIIPVFLVPYVWAIVDIIRRPESQFPNGTGKTGWLIALIVGTFFGLGWLVAVLYVIRVRRRQGPVQPAGPASPPTVPTS